MTGVDEEQGEKASSDKDPEDIPNLVKEQSRQARERMLS